MLDETFAEAIIHRRRPYRVLGRRLLPLSLWHEALLDCHQSPFAYWNSASFDEFIGVLFDGKFGDYDFAALYVASEICRCSWPHRPDLSPARRISRKIAAWRYAKRFAIELRAFSAYLADYRSSPEPVVSSEACPVKTPWYLYTVEALRLADQHLSEADAWNSQPSLSKWRFVARAEASGDKVDIVTPEDRAQCRELGIEI